ncbi:hypothetical protein GCM10022226_74970 [Sphaerisporangium flaviroseum]|uniref:PH domain-containing protein n=1 Tax=Sphaerisporangium flaviroseum TaxID=509199 RepID=A0ABP7JD34_9ACTN
MSSKDFPPVLGPEIQRRLGPLVAEHQPSTGGSGALTVLLSGIGAGAIGLLVMWAALATEIRLLALFGLLIFLIGPVMLILSVKTALQGSQHYYLHAGGLVRVQNRKPTVVTWPEVAALRKRRAAKEVATLDITRDTVMGYKVTLKDGSGFLFVVSDIQEAQARFCARLDQLATGAGVPISG